MTTMDSGHLLADRYRIDRPIGRGGMATVYAGRDSRLGRPVAVKCLRPELSDGASRRRFEMEGQMAARLNHPNIVSVHDAGEDGLCAFMVMELLPGRTLADEMAAGPMSSDRCADVARQVLTALSAAHEAGVIHRDIKPSNLLFSPDGRVKVADFGIATSLDAATDLTRTGELIGTTSYIAPERLAGARASAASDLYSLGAVLYECLTGRRMFTADSQLAYARQVMDVRPAPVASVAPGTDPALAAAIDRVLAKDPAHRFATAPDMLAALDHLPEQVEETVDWGLPPSAPVAGVAPTDVLLLPPPRRSLVDRRRWAAVDRRRWAAAAIVAAIAILIVVALASNGHSAASRPTPTTVPAPTVAPVAISPAVPAPLARDLTGLQAAVSSK